MDEYARKLASVRGHGEIVKTLHTAVILHNGWEMDNEGWVVELADGQVICLTTNHGGVYAWEKEDAEKKLIEIEQSAASIRKALEMWPQEEST